MDIMNKYIKVPNNGISSIVNSKHWKTEVKKLPTDEEATGELYTLLKGLTNDLFIYSRNEKSVIVLNKGIRDSLTFYKNKE